MKKTPIVLCILDGFGAYNASDEVALQNNAIYMAKTPFIDHLLKDYPSSLLKTSGADVGLPDGQMGNSEVGHMTIGSGRVVPQDLPRINAAISDGTLANAREIKDLVATLKASNKACHLLGMISDGGVHSHIDHIISLAKIISSQGIYVHLHAILDGRDVAPNSAMVYLRQLESLMEKEPLIKIATIGGRYFAMDRDHHLDRIALAVDAMRAKDTIRIKDITDFVQENYQNNISDEFMRPVIVGGYEGIDEQDAIIMANFRADRARQILTALTLDDAKRFSYLLGMSEYSEELSSKFKTIFKSEKFQNILPEVISNLGLTQLRLAETEKYAHVTFFLSGGREEVYPGEERILVQSPNVPTYDLRPEMSADAVTNELVKAIESQKFDLIIVNYANCDMVGHTGNLPATIKAIEAIDAALQKMVEAIHAVKGIALITADHGNAEMMQDPISKQPHTSHTLNPVPLIFVSDKKNISLANGRLCDIAPTILNLMGINIPKEMTGKNLLRY